MSVEVCLKKKMLHIRFLQILRNGDSALMKGVLGDGLVGVDWTQAITRHNLTICGIAGCVFNHIVLKR